MVKSSAKTISFSIQDEIDITLPVKRHIARTVTGSRRETQLFKQGCQRFRLSGLRTQRTRSRRFPLGVVFP